MFRLKVKSWNVVAIVTACAGFAGKIAHERRVAWEVKPVSEITKMKSLWMPKPRFRLSMLLLSVTAAACVLAVAGNEIKKRHDRLPIWKIMSADSTFYGVPNTCVTPVDSDGKTIGVSVIVSGIRGEVGEVLGRMTKEDVIELMTNRPTLPVTPEARRKYYAAD